MHQIRDLQTLEDEIREDLAVIYSLDDPDDVPIELDFLHLYNNFEPDNEESVNEQKSLLREALVSSYRFVYDTTLNVIQNTNSCNYWQPFSMMLLR